MNTKGVKGVDNKTQPLIDNDLIARINGEVMGFADVIDRPNPDVWFIQLKEYEIFGFISCENNESDIMIPTISIALVLYDITALPREGLLELLSLNGDFHGCTLCADNFDGNWKLVINRRIMVASYLEGELPDNIELMLERLWIFQDQIEQILMQHYQD